MSAGTLRVQPWGTSIELDNAKSVAAVQPVQADGTLAKAVPVGSSDDPTKVFSHSLWTDGTRDGSGGGTAVLAGNFSVTPRVVYYTAPAGGVRITDLRFFVGANSALSAGGWGTGAPTLTNGIRFEVVNSAPTTPATAPIFRLNPSGASTATNIKSNIDVLKSATRRVDGAFSTHSIVASMALPEGGIPLQEGQSIRVVVQDDTSSATACRAEITYGPLT
jgi:hypothetical protein